MTFNSLINHNLILNAKKQGKHVVHLAFLYILQILLN